MFAENKNLKVKDSEGKPLASYGAGIQNMSLSVSYTKTNKLITALYMVTDIIDKDEPLRNKLRTLGLEILSDVSPMSKGAFDIGKIDQVMSFLDIASAINIISEMNCSILKKEFLDLNQSIEESNNKVKTMNGQLNLSEFFRDSPLEEYPLGGGGIFPSPEGLSTTTSGHLSRGGINSKGHYSIGHRYPTRLGVQKGSTLLKALSKVEGMKALSDKIGTEARPQWLGSSYIQNFEILKKQRRNDIISIIKTIGGNVTIKDIKDRAQSLPAETGTLSSYSEKTLQRELVLMVKDSVLNKVGEKRWSRYGLGSSN